MKLAGASRPAAAEAVAFGLLLVHAWVRFVPWHPAPVGTDIEASWRWVLHLAADRGFVWGRDIVFTHGPYGFLITDSYDPGTFAPTILGLAAVALLLVAGVWRVVRAGIASLGWSLAVSALLIELMSLGEVRQNLFLHVDFVLCWLAWTLRRRTDAERRPIDAWILNGLVAAAALGGLVKFTFLLGGLCSLSALAAPDRTFVRAVATFAASFVGLWVLARQPLSALVPYLSTSVEIAGAYGESMGLRPPPRDVALFLVAAAVALLPVARIWRRERSRGSWIHPAGCGLLIFLDFKSGFVRGDVPHRLAAACALLSWLAIALVPAGKRSTAKASIAIGVVALAPALLLLSSILGERSGAGVLGFAGSNLRAWPVEFGGAVRALFGRTGLPESDRSALAGIRREEPIPGLSGAVDLYTARVGLALAEDVDYRPRPVFQSYCAFTPSLLERNAEHLVGPRAPETILFTVVDWIDGRMPAMDDSLSWPTILSRYRVAGSAAGHLVLRKRDSARPYTLRPIAGLRVGFGQPVRIGEHRSGSATWAEIDVRPTPMLRAWSVLDRPPVLVLSVLLASGERRAYRLVPGIARAGILLSPVIEEDAEFARFAADGRGALAAHEVDSISVASPESADIGWAYGAEFEIRLFALELER